MIERVLVSTSSIGEAALALLESAGLDVSLNPHGRKLTPEESRALLGEVTGLVAGTERLDAEVLAAAPKLRVISRVGTGMDAIDFEATAARGIEVYNTPDAHVDAVAELTLGGLLALLRGIAASDASIRAGGWQRPMGGLLRGRCVGLVGFGRVARRLAALLAPFEMTLLATDPAADPTEARAAGIELLAFDALLARADILSLHVPGQGGRPLLDAAALQRLPRGAVLLNTARGDLVDEAALLAHLDADPDFSAYLDVFPEEPYRGPLASHPRVLLSGHIGSYAREARVLMERQAVEHLLHGLARTAPGAGA